MSAHYHEISSRSYHLLQLKLRLAGLFGYSQRSDIVGKDSYGRFRNRRQFLYLVYVGRRYGS